jgi:hypothetical protein
MAAEAAATAAAAPGDAEQRVGEPLGARQARVDDPYDYFVWLGFEESGVCRGGRAGTPAG